MIRINSCVSSVYNRIQNSMPKSLDARVLSISVLAGLVFSGLAYLAYSRWQGSNSFTATNLSSPKEPDSPNLVEDLSSSSDDENEALSLRRHSSLTRVRTLFKKDLYLRLNFSLVGIRDRLENFINEIEGDHSSKNEEEKADRERIKELSLKMTSLKEMIQICKKYSEHSLPFAFYEIFYANMLGIKDDSLELLFQNWKNKGYIITLSDEVDSSYEPILAKYRDILLFYAPYISDKRKPNQAIKLLQIVKKSNETPDRVIEYLKTFLLPLFRQKGLELSHDIIKGLQDLANENKAFHDAIYIDLIFPILKKEDVQKPPMLIKLREIVNKALLMGSSLEWLKGDDFVFVSSNHPLHALRMFLLGSRKLEIDDQGKAILEEQRSEQTYNLSILLKALFSEEEGRNRAIESFLRQQLANALPKPVNSRAPLNPNLGTWNEKQPLQIKKDDLTELHTYYSCDIEGNYALSFLLFQGNQFKSLTPAVVISVEELKQNLGEKFLENKGLNRFFLEKALQVISVDLEPIRQILTTLLDKCPN